MGADVGAHRHGASECRWRRSKRRRYQQPPSTAIAEDPDAAGLCSRNGKAGTFNVDAVAAVGRPRSGILHSTAKDSVDIHLKSGTDYSVNHGTAEPDRQQARFNPGTGQASYQTFRQIARCRKTGPHIGEALRNEPIREDVSKLRRDRVEADRQLRNDEVWSPDLPQKRPPEEDGKEARNRVVQGRGAWRHSEGAIQDEIPAQSGLWPDYTAAAITVAVQLLRRYIKPSISHQNGELDLSTVKAHGRKEYRQVEGFASRFDIVFTSHHVRSGALGEALKVSRRFSAPLLLWFADPENSILVAAGR